MRKSLRGLFALACAVGSDSHALLMHARLGERRALSKRALTLPELKPAHRSQYRVGIQPRLQLRAALRNQATQLNRTQLEHRTHFAMVELVEIKKRERASLRIGRACDPDGELLRLKLA